MTVSRLRKPSKNHPRSRKRRRKIFESLEPRCLLASLGGEVFLDADGDGSKGPSEVGQPGVRVYVDANDNARLDAGERSATTDALGRYQFDDLASGDYGVRILTPDSAQSSPTAYLGTGYPVIGDGSGTNPTQLFEMSLDGEVTYIGGPTSSRIHGLVRTNDGTLIGVNHENDNTYVIDAFTGQETLLHSTNENVVAGLAYDAGTDTIYTVTREADVYQLRTVDKESGRLSAPPEPALRAINYGSTFFDFDTESSSSTEIARQPLSPFASTLDSRSDGAIFGLQGTSLNQYSFPAEGSTATRLSTLSQPIEAISFNGSDQLFGISSTGSSMHPIDPNTGVVGAGVTITFEGNTISSLTGFDIAPDGTHYLVDSTHLYTFDPITGVASQFPDRALPPSSPIFTSLSVSEDGALYATLFNTTTPLAEIDPVTGLATQLGNNPDGSPYASVVVWDGDRGLESNQLGGISDLTFDPIGQRVVGFANSSDQFFEFTTDGTGSLLAKPERSLHSWSLAFNGTSYVMFDQADPNRTATITVDPDTGTIGDGFTASRRNPAESLFHAKTGDVANRVSLGGTDVLDVDFGVLRKPPVGVPLPDSGVYINELMLEPLFGDRDTDQYVELRGPKGESLADGTYLVIVEEDNFKQGEIHGIFDLSNQSFGANGFLTLLQHDNPYTVDPLSNVLESAAEGFGGLPGNLYTDSHPLSDRIDFNLRANAFFLIETDTPPQLGDDIDVDDNGLADPTGVKSNWRVLDSVSFHQTTSIADQAYGNIVLRAATLVSDLTVEPGVEVVIGRGSSGYVGRIGDSIGSSADDWLMSTAVAPDPVTRQTTVYELESGIFGVPVPPAFNGRDLDHIGASNFNGGVSGTVNLVPKEGETDSNGQPLPTVPGAGVIVLADTNDNWQRDVLPFDIDPDDGVDPNNLVDGNGDPLPQFLTNTYDGVTITTADQHNNILGFDIEATFETNNFVTSTNRIFSHNGIDFFTKGQRLRFDFYRPVRQVSIEAIGSQLSSNETFGRLEAYNANDEMIGFVRSGILAKSLRQTITFTSSKDDIAYAVAFSDEDFGSWPFGRFDNFAFAQAEATAVTDQNGHYEIKDLFEGSYGIRLIDAPEFIGGQSVSIGVTENENYVVDFGLTNNLPPETEDSFQFSIAENAPVGSSVGFVTGSDPDGQTLTYVLTHGQEFGLVINSATGEITVGDEADLNFEDDAQYPLRVAVIDESFRRVTTDVTVSLTDVNEAPIVVTGDVETEEGVSNGTIIGRINASDPDIAQNQTLTYRVVGGSGEGIFAVNPANGFISVIDENAVDHESLPLATLQVEVADSANPPATTSIVQNVRILDQNDAPMIVTETIMVPENKTGIVGNIDVDEPDAGQTAIVQLTGGTGASLFHVQSDGTVILRDGAALDFESVASYTLIVQAIDNGSPPRASTESITVVIQNVEEAPLLDPQSASLGENASEGDLVSTVTAIDPDGVTPNYVLELLSSDDAADFDFDPATGRLTVAAAAALDFESDPTRELRFRIVDPLGNEATAEETFVVTLLDENEPPILVTEGLLISELAAPGSTVGSLEVHVTDPVASGNVTAEIIGGNAAELFDLDPLSRTLTVADGAEFDADVPGETLTLLVRVTDATGLSTTGTITVELNAVDEPPVFTGQPPNPAPIVSGETLVVIVPPTSIVDPEGNDFSLVVFDENNSLPSWMSFDPITGTLSGLPNPTVVGSFTMTLRAFQPGPVDLFSDISFTIVVEQGQTPLTNQTNALDVDSNDSVAALDALRVINFIGRFGVGVSITSVLGTFYGFVDVSGDGTVTALDALLVINGITRIDSGLGGELVTADADDRVLTQDAALTELLDESLLF